MPQTPAATIKARIRANFKRQDQQVRITYTSRLRRVTYPTGARGAVVELLTTCPGYRPQTWVASWVEADARNPVASLTVR